MKTKIKMWLLTKKMGSISKDIRGVIEADMRGELSNDIFGEMMTEHLGELEEIIRKIDKLHSTIEEEA